MTFGVVDDLEVIEVDVKQGAQTLFLARPQHRDFELLFQTPAIVEAGEIVVATQMLQTRFHDAAFGELGFEFLLAALAQGALFLERQCRNDAGHQVDAPYRLEHDVSGAGVETFPRDLFLPGGVGSDHDHRNVGPFFMAPYRTADFVTVHLRHHNVENYYVDAAVGSFCLVEQALQRIHDGSYGDKMGED